MTGVRSWAAVQAWLEERLGAARLALLVSLAKFGTIGASGAVVDTAVVYAVKGWVGLYAAGFVSYLAAATWTWWFNRWWTFAGQGGGPMWRQWLAFLTVNLSGFVLGRTTFVLMVFFSETARSYPVIAVAAGALAGMFANFFASRRLVFRAR